MSGLDHLQLISLYDEPRCTILVRPDGEVYYEMKTEKDVTAVVRGPSGGSAKEGQEVGYIDWSPDQSTISIGQHDAISQSEFLRRRSDTTRVFTGPYGDEYTWESSFNGDLELRGGASSEPIAVFRTARTHILKKNERAQLDISSAGQFMLDYVVITWLWMRNMALSGGWHQESTTKFSHNSIVRNK